MPAEQFYGAWRLVEYSFESSDGEFHYPFGKDAQGIVIYDISGMMSLQIMSRHRSNFAVDDMFQATPEEYKSAFETLHTYFGSFSIDDVVGTITHHVEGASMPNGTGSNLVRYFAFSENGQRLILKGAPRFMNDMWLSGLLIWEKC
jgi:hypothetical protein